jgi:antirestriction protein ArdC
LRHDRRAPCCWSDEDYAGWDWRDHTANCARPSRRGIIRIAALWPLCRYRHNGHASGHPSRLGRDLTSNFGTKKYAFEELVAEMNAAFCCASLGIVPTVRHADYIGSWLEVLREDNRAVMRAASQASKAADWILGFLPETESAATRAASAQEAA